MLLAFVVAASIVLRLGIIEALLRFYYSGREERRRDEWSLHRGGLPARRRPPSARWSRCRSPGRCRSCCSATATRELMRIAIGGLWVFSNYELLMALFRLDERAAALLHRQHLRTSLLTIGLTVWLVVGATRARAACCSATSAPRSR